MFLNANSDCANEANTTIKIEGVILGNSRWHNLVRNQRNRRFADNNKVYKKATKSK